MARILSAAVILLAGCVAPSGIPVEDPPAGSSSEEGSWVARAAGWLREYWGSSETKTVVDKEFSSDAPQVNPEGACFFCTFFGVEFGEALVPPDTESVAFRVTEPSPQGMEYYILVHPADGGEHRVDIRDGAGVYALQSGDADAALQRRSFWSLTIHPYQSGGNPVAPGIRFSLTATALRASEPLPLPNPPDWWANTESRTLFENDTRTLNSVSGPTGCFSCTVRWMPPEGSIVPPGTRVIRGLLEWDWTSPARPVLWASSGSTEDARQVNLTPDSGPRAGFAFEVPPEWVDSPWQTRSAWVMFAVVNSDSEAGAVSGSIRLTADVSQQRP